MFSLRKITLNALRLHGKSTVLCEARFATYRNLLSESENPQRTPNVLNVDQQAVNDVVDYSIHGPSAAGVQGGHDDLLDAIESSNGQKKEELPVSNDSAESYNCNNNVNLHGCMQTNVPEPFNSGEVNHTDHYNMPGAGGKLFQKYIQDVQSSNHQNRTYHTSARRLSAQAAEKPQFEEYELAPQGVQGDDCVNLRLWMENCQKYGLPNCDEQLNSVVSGRKTLAQVFTEQEEIIQEVAESYRRKRLAQTDIYSDMQGVQDMPGARNINIADCSVQGVQGVDVQRSYYLTSPQGIQGDECIQFKLWLENCNRFGLTTECEDQLIGLESGRKTLAQVFAEQDALIRRIVLQYKSRRHYSTSSNQEPEVGKDDSAPKSSTNPADVTAKLSQRERLTLAIRDYGSTVLVFHISISLVSLGCFYLAVSSGIDMVAILKSLGVSEAVVQSRLASGASTFVVAYAVHKVFAPVRIGITLTATPFIVQYLRRVGFLKVKPKP